MCIETRKNILRNKLSMIERIYCLDINHSVPFYTSLDKKNGGQKGIISSIDVNRETLGMYALGGYSASSMNLV